MTLASGRFLYTCHYQPSCTAGGQETIRAAVAALLPGCTRPPRTSRTAPGNADWDTLTALARRDLPATAYRIGILRLAGFSAAKARAELGLAKSTYYKALRDLGQ